MGKAKKHILFPVLVMAFLLVACTSRPAPVVTQDPSLIQQAIEQSVALTLVVERAQATEQQASGDTQTPISTPEPVDELPDVPEANTQEPETVSELPDVTTQDTGDGSEKNCSSFLQSELKLEVSEIKDLQSQLNVGDMVTIKQAVNLRTRPSLKNRIILTLKPDVQVEVIGGPVETLYQSGATYVWWQVKIPGGLTGWSAEISLCRQFYFMEPVE